MLLALLGSLMGCTTLATLDGARTLDEGEWQVAMAGSIQARQNPVSTATHIPVPQAEVALRYGLRPYMDIGTRIYLGGLATDFRYQFHDGDTWDLAVAPGIGGIALPLPGFQSGVVDVRVPVRAQRDLGSKFSWSGGVTPMARNTFTFVQGELGTGNTGKMDLYLGLSSRLEFHKSIVYVGWSVDWLPQPAYGSPPAFSTGFDVGLRPRRR